MSSIPYTKEIEFQAFKVENAVRMGQHTYEYAAVLYIEDS